MPFAVWFTPAPAQPQDTGVYVGDYQVAKASSVVRARPSAVVLEDGTILAAGGGMAGELPSSQANDAAPRLELMVPSPPELAR